MTRPLLPLVVPDLSAFARALARALAARHVQQLPPPGHSEVLNLVAAALGHRNYQSLRAAAAALAVVPSPAPDAEPAATATAPSAALGDNARKALGQFDAEGRLVRWPVKFSVQRLVLWVLWTRFESKRVYSEREVNAILRAANAFGDHATLRRGLVDHRLLARKSDCSEYRKLAARADDETRALLGAWRERFRAG